MKIKADNISTNNLILADNPKISSFKPAENRIIRDAVIESKMDISRGSNINEPKNPLTKNAPKDTPKPPRCGVLFSCELLSFGLAVRFLMKLT